MKFYLARKKYRQIDLIFPMSVISAFTRIFTVILVVIPAEKCRKNADNIIVQWHAKPCNGVVDEKAISSCISRSKYFYHITRLKSLSVSWAARRLQNLYNFLEIMSI